MGTAERREREKEELRSRIVEAARDLLSEQGLAGFSMRSIAERIEYAPATIYLYFKDKDELLREVVDAGFERLRVCVAEELRRLGETADAAEQYGAMGRAYARFAIDNPAYFRVMFELPGTACVECPSPDGAGVRGEGDGFDAAVDAVRRASAAGLIDTSDARRTALIGWALIHGLTSLYLSGQLVEDVRSHEEFLALVEEAMRVLGTGWRGPAERSSSQVRAVRATGTRKVKKAQ